jgi:Ca2+-binding RTX toxin-like protein
VSGEGFVAFTVDEAAQGVDLNGNGSAFDAAVWHVTGADGVTVNLGLAGPPPIRYGTANGPGFAFAVDETAQGVDLNGDGTATDDAVWHVYRPSDGVTNLQVVSANNRIWAWSGGFLFHVDEGGQGAGSLNGDGDTLDNVWHAFEWGGGVTNLGLAALQVLIGDDLTAGDGALVWASEASQGATDLNGDGDADDTTVYHVWHPVGGITNLALAGPQPTFRSYGAGIGIVVSEVAHFGADLNGDGDATDQWVWHVHRPGVGTTNLQVASDIPLWSLPLEDGLAFTIGEPAQGGTVLNGDGDAADEHVWQVYREGSGVTNLAIAGATAAIPIAGGVALQVSEEAQDTDLNGDTDKIDTRVWHVYRTGIGVTNLGLATDSATSEAIGTGFAFGVSEPAQGGANLNGDADVTDVRVVHVWDPSGGVTNLGLATSGSDLLDVAGSLFFRVAEFFQGGIDRNGDGDASDTVWALYEPGTGITNLSLAPGFPRIAVAIDDGVVFTVDEASQGGTDLNGDGDATDTGVWHHHHPLDGTTSLQIAGAFHPSFFAEAATGSMLSVTVDEVAQGGAILNGDGDTLDDVRHAVFFCSGRLPTWLGTGGPDTHLASTGNDVLIGLGGDDSIDAAAGSDLVCAGPGNDTVDGRAGPDVIFGGDGDDILAGCGAGDTVLGEDGNDTLRGGPGDDLLLGGSGADVLVDGKGDDTYHGGPGPDWLYFTTAPGPVTANLTTGTATGNGTETLTSIERLRGSSYDDVLTGDSRDNELNGILGNDVLHGGAGDDTLYGLGGMDELFGDAGDDRLYGGLHADVLRGGIGADIGFGGAGADELYGGTGADDLYGQAGPDTIWGRDGDDGLYGAYGDDWLYGEHGNDVLFGRSGDDHLDGGPDTDELDGGLGSDTCVNGEVENRCE